MEYRMQVKTYAINKEERLIANNEGSNKIDVVCLSDWHENFSRME
jgi:hypothetical protein